MEKKAKGNQDNFMCTKTNSQSKTIQRKKAFFTRVVEVSILKVYVSRRPNATRNNAIAVNLSFELLMFLNDSP